MKRSAACYSSLEKDHDSINTANVLMLLSRVHDDRRVFECKSCSRQFPSFQALGGHMASHKKPRPSDHRQDQTRSKKPKVHGCSVCGLEFAIGQALGGHMRRHRAASNDQMFGHNESRGFVEKKSNNCSINGKRVNLLLDLNLPPATDDEMMMECIKLGLGMEFVEKAHMVDYCFQ